jgi:RNA polymerase sigma factor (sigma-70 family)
MNFDIVGVGTPKKKYRKFNNAEFESLESYRAQAKKLIIHYSNKRRSQVLLNDLINSEDAISAVANSPMIADWTYDCDRESEHGKCSQNTYRFLRATWAIKSYLTRRTRHVSRGNISLDQSLTEDDNNMYGLLPDSCESPDQSIKTSELREILENILSSTMITDRQSFYLREHYLEEKPLTDIAEEAGVSRQAVYDGLKRAISFIRQELNITAEE